MRLNPLEIGPDTRVPHKDRRRVGFSAVGQSESETLKEKLKPYLQTGEWSD